MSCARAIPCAVGEPPCIFTGDVPCACAVPARTRFQAASTAHFFPASGPGAGDLPVGPSEIAVSEPITGALPAAMQAVAQPIERRPGVDVGVRVAGSSAAPSAPPMEVDVIGGVSGEAYAPPRRIDGVVSDAYGLAADLAAYAEVAGGADSGARGPHASYAPPSLRYGVPGHAGVSRAEMPLSGAGPSRPDIGALLMQAPNHSQRMTSPSSTSPDSGVDVVGDMVGVRRGTKKRKAEWCAERPDPIGCESNQRALDKMISGLSLMDDEDDLFESVAEPPTDDSVFKTPYGVLREYISLTPSGSKSLSVGVDTCTMTPYITLEGEVLLKREALRITPSELRALQSERTFSRIMEGFKAGGRRGEFNAGGLTIGFRVIKLTRNPAGELAPVHLKISRGTRCLLFHKNTVLAWSRLRGAIENAVERRIECAPQVRELYNHLFEQVKRGVDRRRFVNSTYQEKRDAVEAFLWNETVEDMYMNQMGYHPWIHYESLRVQLIALKVSDFTQDLMKAFYCF